MARIFISHSSRDNTFAMEIKKWLESQGFDQSFLDFDKHSGIEPGENWEKTLYREIDRSQAVLLVLTPNWNESKWCFAEYTQARALGKAIFPLIYAPLESHQTATNIQHLDLTQNKEVSLQELYKELRQVALDAQGGFSWDKTRSPFPGLMYFTEEDAAIFFGRDDDVRRVIECLNARRTQGGARLVVMLGASGSGKSSLLRAGVLPRMKRDKKNWIVLPAFRPQKRPVYQFARALALASEQQENWQDYFDKLMGDDYLSALIECADQIRATTNFIQPEILVSLDQGEELFTIADQQQTKRFCEIITTIQKESLPYLIVTTLRSDFLDTLQQQEQLTERFEGISIKPMPLERIPNVIRGPAEVVGFEVSESFISAATHDAQTEDALPLLAFTLRQLYERFGSDGALTLDEYQALGNTELGLNPLENTVRQVADDVLKNENPSAEELKALREVFVPGLARINDEGEYVRRPALWDELPAKAYPLLEKLIQARLLLLHQDNDKKILEVTHEALLRKWQTLYDWLNEEREFLIGKARLEQALIDWQQADENYKGQALLTGLQLTRAGGWFIEHPLQLSEDEKGFIQASLAYTEADQKRRAKTQKMLTRGALAASVILAVSAIFSGWQWKKAEASRFATEIKEQKIIKERDKALRFLTDMSFQQLRDGKPVEAILLALETLPDKSEEGDSSSSGDKSLALDVVTALDVINSGVKKNKVLKVLREHKDEVLHASFNPAGTQLVTVSMDKMAHLWDVSTGKLLHTLDSHKGFVRYAAFNSTGTQLVTAGKTTACVWDTANGELLHTLEGHTENLKHAAFNPGGTQVVTSSLDNTARLWNVENGELLHELKGHTDDVRYAAFNHDGTQLVTASRDKTARLWNVASGQLLHLLKQHKKSLSHADFNHDGTRLVTASIDKTAGLWKVASGQLLHLLNGHEGGVSHAGFSHDGTQLVTASTDNTARLWNVLSGDLIHIFDGHTDGVRHAAFNSSGTQVLTASGDKTARLWDVDSGELLRTLEGHTDDVRHADFNFDGTRVVTASADKTARLWDVKSDEVWLHKLKGHTDDVKQTSYSHDGTQIVTASDDNTARLWGVKNGELLHVLEGHTDDVKHAAFNHDDTLIVTASNDNTARLWNENGELLHVLKGHTDDVRYAGFNRDGTQIVTASWDNTARLWNVESGELLHTLEGHTDDVKHAGFNQDGTQVVTASWDETARLWDVANGMLLHTLKGHTSGLLHAVFNHDGTHVVTAGDRAARLWSVANGKLLHTFEGHRSWVRYAGFNHDGTQVVTTSRDNKAHLWSVTTGELLHILKGHTDDVRHATFNSAGTQVVTASKDKTARLWDANSGELIHILKGHENWVDSATFNSKGTQVLTGSVDDTARIWKVFPSTKETVKYARSYVPECLAPEQRKKFNLDKTPPSWCLKKLSSNQ